MSSTVFSDTQVCRYELSINKHSVLPCYLAASRDGIAWSSQAWVGKTNQASEVQFYRLIEALRLKIPLRSSPAANTTLSHVSQCHVCMYSLDSSRDGV